MGTCRGQHGDCPNEAKRDGLCWGHVKAKSDGRGIDIELQAPKGAPRARAGLEPVSHRELLREAALAYADAEDDDDYRRADDNLAKTAQRFAKGGAKDAIDEALAARQAEINAAIREGMARRAAEGVSVGRPANGTSRWTAWRRHRAQLPSDDVAKG